MVTRDLAVASCDADCRCGSASEVTTDLGRKRAEHLVAGSFSATADDFKAASPSLDCAKNSSLTGILET